MDLKAQYQLETCSDPIEFLRQLRQTTEPIGGSTIYDEDGELVEYDIAIEAVRKANNASIKKACEWLKNNLSQKVSVISGGYVHINFDNAIEEFRKYMKGE